MCDKLSEDHPIMRAARKTQSGERVVQEAQKEVMPSGSRAEESISPTDLRRNSAVPGAASGENTRVVQEAPTPTTNNQQELFVVERVNGEWIDIQGEGGYSCFLSLAEAQEALESEADNCEEDESLYKIVRFARVAQATLRDSPQDSRIQSFWDAQAAWSQATFGVDSERDHIGPLKHLAKEAVEAQVRPSDPVEIADCLFLVFDAARRSGMTLDTLIKVAEQKLLVNKARKWQKPTDDNPVEHVRDSEPTVLREATPTLEVLRKLRNEIHGMLGIVDMTELARLVGWTNIRCLETRLTEADKALADSSALSKEK